MTTRIPRRALPPPAAWPRFVELDLRSLVPLGRTLLLTVCVLILLTVATAPSAVTTQLTASVMLSVVVPSLLFSNDEQAGLDLLHRLLPIRARTRVIGRYASVLLTGLAGIGVGTAAALLASAFKPGDPAELLAGAWMLLVILLVLHSVQLPVYFALGYQRARMVTLVTVLAVAGVTVLLFGDVLRSGGGGGLPPVLLGALLPAAALLYAASALFSYRLDVRREF